ncbi:MAG: asparagine synthase [Armatimonadetes bacterium]|nr:asparagine synthase [Armatimonadota bacterium]
MAGIVGIARKGETAQVRSALARIAHRGGAGSSVWSHEGATLGVVWPAAQQLAQRASNRYGVALDGDIHNWTDIGAGSVCPLEALERECHQSGPGFAAGLDGPFALAIAAADGVFLARDVVGKSPLYVGRCRGALCFASEVKALAGWADDIREFPPGHYRAPGEGLVAHARLEEQPPLAKAPAEVATELRRRLVASVRKRMAPGEMGAWLSGGLDSAALTALAAPQADVLRTFSVGVDGSPDLHYARIVAGHVGSHHHERVVTVAEMTRALPEVIYHLESFDALLVRSSITNYLVGQLASDHVPVTLSGEGGDELFGGYDYLKELPIAALPAELIDITGRLHNTALQRVDRCSAAHGLVARTAFLDRDVLAYALRIPPEMKIHRNGNAVEKWILRAAIEGLLPDEVTNRPKAKFWQGAGVGELLAERADAALSDADFAAGRALPDGSRARTKEELWYYRIFREQFGDDVSPALVGRTKGAPEV